MAVDVKIHAFEVALDDTGTEVGHGPRAIGLDGCLCVLHHVHAVLVVGIGNGEGVLVESVEEHFLGVAVVLYGLMIVQMVAGEVGEESACEVQSADAVLGNGVAGAFHEGILAAGLHHTGQQGVQLYGVGGGVAGGHRLALNIVAHRRQQAAAVSQLAEHII